MNNNSDPPEGWGIPNDQATKVREALNRKYIRPEDAVQNALDEIARDIAIIEPDPIDWGWWVSYLLEQMEMQTAKHQQINQYEYTLKVLSEKLQNRVKDGKW